MLLLYGERDALIPASATETVIEALDRAGRAEVTVMRYPEGYHLLLHDRQAQRVIEDVRDWVLGGLQPGAMRPARTLRLVARHGEGAPAAQFAQTIASASAVRADTAD